MGKVHPQGHRHDGRQHHHQLRHRHHHHRHHQYHLYYLPNSTLQRWTTSTPTCACATATNFSAQPKLLLTPLLPTEGHQLFEQNHVQLNILGSTIHRPGSTLVLTGDFNVMSDGYENSKVLHSAHRDLRGQILWGTKTSGKSYFSKYNSTALCRRSGI